MEEIDDKKWAWVLNRLEEFYKDHPHELEKLKGEDRLIELNK